MDDWKRWVLLEHVGAPDDLNGIHFDLLLEDEFGCRAWRLMEIPSIDGPSVSAVRLSKHDLKWLDVQSAPVSGNRGWAKRLSGGSFKGPLPHEAEQSINVLLKIENLLGLLEIQNHLCRISSVNQF